MMENDPGRWILQLIRRKLVLISGFLAWPLGQTMFRSARMTVSQADWQPLVTHNLVLNGLFLGFLLFSLGWIAFSLLAIRAMARRPDLQARVKSLVWGQPILLHVLAFNVHWAMATFYLLVVGIDWRPPVVGLMSVVHILAMLWLGPAIIGRADSKGE